MFVNRYKVQPSYHAVLGAETMFALAAGYNKSTYTPESFVKAMEQASKALNEKINIKIIEFSSKMIKIYCAVLFIFGVQIACQMTFVSIGNAKSSIIVAVVRKFVLLLPLIYIMPVLMKNNTVAVYSAEPVADLIAVTFTAILFVFQFKKSIKIRCKINFKR